MAEALTATRSTAVEFACGADVGVDGTAKGRYVLFVEWEGAPADPRRFLEALAAGFPAEAPALRRYFRDVRRAAVAL